MPKFIYTPEGADPITWDFDPYRLMSPEAEAIERVTGMTYGQAIAALPNGSMSALHGLLWVLLKRQHPTLKYDEVQFCIDEVKFEPNDDADASEDADDDAEPEGEDPAAEADPKA